MSSEAKIEFYRHHLGRAEAKAVAGVIDSLFLTTGKKCAEFELAFADYLGAPKVVAVSSGTAGLVLALKALNIGSGDEVITTPMTFVATANACLEVGAKPVFADVEPDTGNLSVEQAAAAVTEQTAAILPVHLYGAMCDMVGLRALADEHGLKLIADCAHAVESRRDGFGSADLIDAAVYSFYATKNLTCGEGGAVACADEAIAKRIKLLRMHGMSREAAERYHGKYQHYDVAEVGLKANLPDLLAAMLLPQIAGIDARLARREQIALRYEAAFAAMDGVDFPRVDQGTVSGRHLFTIWVEQRDEFLGRLQARGIGVAVNYRPVHLLALYRERLGFGPGDFPQAERIGDSTISLPFYPLLSDEEVERVIAAVGETAAELDHA